MNISTDLIRSSSVYKVLEVIGDRWTITILHQSFHGVHGFEEFQRRLNIPRSTLSSRLKRLIEYGLFEQRPATTPDQRWEYRLTEIGKDFLPCALLALEWQTNWVEGAPQGSIIHKSCGAQVFPELICEHCRVPVEANNVSFKPGPGANRAAGQNQRRRRSVAKAAHSDFLPVSGELLDILGDRWTPQVMALGFFSIRRFDDMLDALGVASNILTDRLKRLVEMGMLEQHLYQTRPARKEYRLTDKGRALYPLLVSLTQWGDKWFCGPEGKPIILYHNTCGHELNGLIVCRSCKEVILPGSTQPGHKHPQ